MSSVKFSNGVQATHVVLVKDISKLYHYPSGDVLPINDNIRELLNEIQSKSMHASFFKHKEKYLIYTKNDYYYLDSSQVEIVEKLSLSPVPKMQLMGFFISTEKVIKVWIWKPQASLTILELSLFLPLLFTSGSAAPVVEEELMDISENWKDHFEIKEVPAPVTNSKEYLAIQKSLSLGAF